MPRPFRVLAVGVVLVLATAGAATSASATPATPALPDSMAAIGDSITQAVDVCCFYGNWPGHSWSTGYVPLDGIAGHYERIRARNPAIRGHRWNNAVSGAQMADAPGQARRTVGQAVIDREREFNDVLRDVCATWSNCRFDNYLTYDYAFTRDMVSRLDFFHPSLRGQATLAALTWEASWWGS
jgi:hypothetical protein